MTVEAILNPLVRRGLFSDVEHAARSLRRDYVLQQIDLCRKETAEYENKHGMSFEQFTRYTEKRAEQLRQASDWPKTERIALAQAIMQDEQDWLEWKATEEILCSWLGLQGEA